MRLADVVKRRAPQVSEGVVQEFAFDGTAAGWQVAAGMDALDLRDGGLVGATRSEGVGIEWPQTLAADEVTHIRLSISCTSDAVVEAHWRRADGSPGQLQGPVASPVHGYAVQRAANGAADGAAVSQTIELPLEAHAEWRGAVTAIRVTVFAPAGGRFRIERLAFIKRELTWRPSDDAAVIRRFDLSGADGASGWIGIRGGVLRAEPGEPLRLRSDQVGGAMWCGVDFQAATVTHVAVTMEVMNYRSPPATVQLSWGIDGDFSPSGTRQTTIAAHPGGGTWTYVFDVGGLPVWRARIRWLAIAPDSGGAGVEARIEAIALEHRPLRKALLDEELRTALRVLQGERFACPLSVPPRARFTCLVGLTKVPAESAVSITIGVTPAAGAKRAVVARCRVAAGSDKRAGWIPLEASLGRWGRREVTLDVEVRTSGDLAEFTLANPEMSARAEGLPPNIVVLDIDALRPDHLGCYGYDLPTSPRIDALAARSTVFERAYSQGSWTLPSTASLLTGKLPTDLSVVLQTDRLARRESTLPALLRHRGYATAGFVAGGFVSPDFGLDQSFDIFNYPRDEADLECTLEHLRRWLMANAWRPFFLFFHTLEVHDWIKVRRHHLDPFLRRPYHGPITGCDYLTHDPKPTWPTEDDIAYMRALYDGEVHCTDEYVGRLIRLLEALGLRDNTIIVLAADHGEAILDRQGHLGHGGAPFDELIRVPLLIHLPAQTEGRRVSTRVGNDSIFATLLDLAGLISPEDAAPSLAPLLAGSAQPPERPIISQDAYHWSLIMGRFKVIVCLAGIANGKVSPEFVASLYDLETDPKELISIAEHEPKVVADLIRALAERVGERARFVILRPYGADQEMQVSFDQEAVEYVIAAAEGARSAADEKMGRLTLSFPSAAPYLPIILCRPKPGQSVRIYVTVGGKPLASSQIYIGGDGRHPEEFPFTIGPEGVPFADLLISTPPPVRQPQRSYLRVYRFGAPDAEQVELTEEVRQQLQALGYM